MIVWLIFCGDCPISFVGLNRISRLVYWSSLYNIFQIKIGIPVTKLPVLETQCKCAQIVLQSVSKILTCERKEVKNIITKMSSPSKETPSRDTSATIDEVRTF